MSGIDTYRQSLAQAHLFDPATGERISDNLRRGLNTDRAVLIEVVTRREKEPSALAFSPEVVDGLKPPSRRRQRARPTTKYS